jgi:hypothetical protein
MCSCGESERVREGGRRWPAAVAPGPVAPGGRFRHNRGVGAGRSGGTDGCAGIGEHKRARGVQGACRDHSKSEILVKELRQTAKKDASVEAAVLQTWISGINSRGPRT